MRTERSRSSSAPSAASSVSRRAPASTSVSGEAPPRPARARPAPPRAGRAPRGGRRRGAGCAPRWRRSPAATGETASRRGSAAGRARPSRSPPAPPPRRRRPSRPPGRRRERRCPGVRARGIHRRRCRPAWARAISAASLSGGRPTTASSTPSGGARSRTAPAAGCARMAAVAEHRVRIVAWTAFVTFPLAGLSILLAAPDADVRWENHPPLLARARHVGRHRDPGLRHRRGRRAPRRRAPVPRLARLPGRGRLPRPARAGDAEGAARRAQRRLRPRHARRAAARGGRSRRSRVAARRRPRRARHAQPRAPARAASSR